MRLRKDIIEAMDQDIQLSFTDDLPTLRFRKEPLYVWLWDHNKEFLSYKKIFSNLVIGRDYRVVCSDALSTEELTPCFNVASSANSYESYILRRGASVPSVTWKPLKVEGKLFEVSLEALELLDYFYTQGYNFIRSNLQVKKQGKVYTSLFYHNTRDQLLDTKGKLMKHLEFIEPDVRTAYGVKHYVLT